jgi:peptidoglycan hydrolase CwlO-like protein
LLPFSSLLFFLGSLFAQTSEELRKQQAEIQKEINELKQSLQSTRKNKKASLGQLALVQKKIRLREQAINNISNQIDMIQVTITQSRNDIIRLKRELDTLKAQYEKSVVYAYKNRSNYDFLNFVFSASSFNDALKRVEYLKTYRNYRQQQAENIHITQKYTAGKNRRVGTYP